MFHSYCLCSINLGVSRERYLPPLSSQLTGKVSVYLIIYSFVTCIYVFLTLALLFLSHWCTPRTLSLPPPLLLLLLLLMSLLPLLSFFVVPFIYFSYSCCCCWCSFSSSCSCCCCCSCCCSCCSPCCCYLIIVNAVIDKENGLFTLPSRQEEMHSSTCQHKLSTLHQKRSSMFVSSYYYKPSQQCSSETITKCKIQPTNGHSTDSCPEGMSWQCRGCDSGMLHSR